MSDTRKKTQQIDRPRVVAAIEINGQIDHGESDFSAGELHEGQKYHEQAAYKISLGVERLEYFTNGADA